MLPADGSLIDRYAGCLLGLACGDALGGPVEFLSRQEVAAAHPDGVREFRGGGWLHLNPGEVTDDTQLTLALARALTERGLDLDLFAAELLAWYHSDPKDIGTTTRRDLEALAAGVEPERAGAVAVAGLAAGGGASNGAGMRCAPVALRFRKDRRRLEGASLASARVTHAEPRAAWATVAVNNGIVHLLNGGSLADLPAAAVEGTAEPEVRAAVLAAPGMEAGRARAGGFVVETLRAAFWSVVHAGSAEEAIVAAVGFGDDADTTGAVAGALAGAHWGASALPDRWLTVLQPRHDLDAHAARLLSLSDAP
ncbi:MAG TPA: ADP-ribosylglycohydrolase family protein [Thermomicrobiales bacterium]|nr:ADP-ribosylglycohydrolase family protein [Thermomicrobiales bacterium]